MEMIDVGEACTAQVPLTVWTCLAEASIHVDSLRANSVRVHVWSSATARSPRSSVSKTIPSPLNFLFTWVRRQVPFSSNVRPRTDLVPDSSASLPAESVAVGAETHGSL